MNKTIRNGTILKSADSPFGDKYDICGLATVEVPDKDGDIVRVAGMSLELHRDESPLKVLLGHRHNAGTDGGLPVVPVVAVAREFKQTTASVNGKEYPAVAFGANYAIGEGDTLTPFASKCKGLIDHGTLDSFSVGLTSCEYKPLKPKGADIYKSKVFEISLCIVPVNPYANILKALTDGLGEDFDENEYTEQKLIDVLKSVDNHGDLLKGLTNRFDRIESAIAALSEGAAKPKASRQSSQSNLSDVQKTLAEIRAVLQASPAT